MVTNAELKLLETEIADLQSRIKHAEERLNIERSNGKPTRELEAQLAELRVLLDEKREQLKFKGEERELEQAAEQEQRKVLDHVTGSKSMLGSAGAAAGAGMAGSKGAEIGSWAGDSYAKRRDRKKREKAAKARAKAKKGGLLTRAKKGYDAINDPFVQAQENLSQAVVGGAQAFDKHAHPVLFALVAAFLHAIDVLGFFGGSGAFDRNATHGSAMFVAYALFALYAALVYYRTGLTKASLRYFGVSLFAFFLPYILQLPYVGNFSYLVALLVIMPIWFLYIALNSESAGLQKFGKWYVYLLVVAFFFILVANFTLPESFGVRGVQVARPVDQFFTDVRDSWETIKERLVSGGIFSPSEWRRRINKTFNPYAQYYTGQVEENQEPTGVFIEDLRSLYPVYHNGSGVDPQVIARVRAKTFLPGGILIEPSCRLERPKQGWVGVSDPPPGEPLLVNEWMHRDIACTYPWADDMVPGTYRATIGATFDYETWSYLTHTFVSRQLIEQYYYQDRDINRDLDIPTPAVATYTNGPVMLGITGGDQPIDINPDAQRADQLVQQRLGFTVENRWPQGRVRHVDTVTILVPRPFVLEECIPTEPARVVETEAYTNYTFTRSEAIELDEQYDFSTVTCQLELPSPQAAQEVLAFGEKTPVTFVVIASYRYTLEKQTSIRIEP